MNQESGRSARGGIYVSVLGVTTMVTVIGLSGLALAQVRRDTTDSTLDGINTRFDGQSALAIALSRVSEASSWSTEFPSGSWRNVETLGGTRWSFMLEYDQGTADAGQPVRTTFTALAARERGARAYSIDADVLRVVGANPNLLTNPGFESGLGDWWAWMSTVDADSSEANSGTTSLRSYSRWFALGGTQGDVTSAVVNDTVYEVSAWVLLDSGSTDQFRVRLNAKVGAVTTETLFDSTDVVGGKWTEISGTVSTGWQNLQKPNLVTLSFETNSTTADFWVDDITLRVAGAGTSSTLVTAIGETFRQRALD